MAACVHRCMACWVTHPSDSDSSIGCIYSIYVQAYVLYVFMYERNISGASERPMYRREREFDERLFVASSHFSLNHWDEMAHLLVCHIEILPDPEPSFGLAETGPVRPIKVFYQGKTEIRV